MEHKATFELNGLLYRYSYNAINGRWCEQVDGCMVKWISGWQFGYPQFHELNEHCNENFGDIEAQINADYKREQEAYEREQEELKIAFEKRQAELAELFDSPKATPIFVRFGEMPESGFSKNGRDNFHEAGVSVYAAKKIGSTIILDWRQVDCVSGMFIANRQAYIATGDQIGTGSDNEPILSNAKIVRKVRKNEIIKKLSK